MNQSPPLTDKLAYRIDEAIKATGLGRTLLYENIASKKLKSFRIGGRRLIHHDDLVSFLNSYRGAE
jgi:excisionase family DNA binding protein